MATVINTGTLGTETPEAVVTCTSVASRGVERTGTPKVVEMTMTGNGDPITRTSKASVRHAHNAGNDVTGVLERQPLEGSVNAAMRSSGLVVSCNGNELRAASETVRAESLKDRDLEKVAR